MFKCHKDLMQSVSYSLLMTWRCKKPGPQLSMMTSSNGNIFRGTGPLCGEFTGHRWIPLTKASEAGLWCFLWSAPWINGWVKNREAGDLRRHRAHHDVTMMRAYSSGTVWGVVGRCLGFGVGDVVYRYQIAMVTQKLPLQEELWYSLVNFIWFFFW